VPQAVALVMRTYSPEERREKNKGGGKDGPADEVKSGVLGQSFLHGKRKKGGKMKGGERNR